MNKLQEAKEEYNSYGDEWKKELMKWTKKQLIIWIRNLLMEKELEEKKWKK